jgi:hypothetical protein
MGLSDYVFIVGHPLKIMRWDFSIILFEVSFLYQNQISFEEIFHQWDITPLPEVEYEEYPESQHKRHCDASNKIATISDRKSVV